MYITEKKRKNKKTLRNHSYFNKNTCVVSHRELWEDQFTVVHCKIYNELFFFHFKKTVNLTVFYSKIISQLFTAYTETLLNN